MGERYEDISGFAKSVGTEAIAAQGFVLTLGRDVDPVAAEADAELFADKMPRLTGELREQMAEGTRLDARIRMRGWGSGMGGEHALSVAELQARGLLLVEDGNHGENRPRPDEFTKSGIAFIRAADMSDGVLHFDQCERINEQGRARVRKGIGQPDDIIISHKGTIGKIAVAPDPCKPLSAHHRLPFGVC